MSLWDPAGNSRHVKSLDLLLEKSSFMCEGLHSRQYTSEVTHCNRFMGKITDGTISSFSPLRNSVGRVIDGRVSSVFQY